MSTINLILLGMIKKQPQSAYELQKNIEYRNISKWVKISAPSIFKKLIQLEEKGYLTSEILREGKMREKAVYSLTDAGEQYFLELMEQNADNTVRVFLDFNAVIVNLDVVPTDMRESLIAAMEEKITAMKEEIQASREKKMNVTITGRSVMKQQYEVADTLQKWIEEFREEYLNN